MATAKRRPEAAGKTKLQMLTGGARVMDGILAVVFVGLAIYSGWWFWWASAALCALTAATAPLDKLYKLLAGKFYFKISRGR